MADEYAKLQQLYAAEKPDAAAIGQTYDALHNLQRQMIQANIDANNRMQAALNEEQRHQLQRWQRGAVSRIVYLNRGVFPRLSARGVALAAGSGMPLASPSTSHGARTPRRRRQGRRG
jgi:hypothetical protein